MGVMDKGPVCRWIRDWSVGWERLSRDQLGGGDGAESLTHWSVPVGCIRGFMITPF